MTMFWQLERIVSWLDGDLRTLFLGSRWETIIEKGRQDSSTVVPEEAVVFAVENSPVKTVWRVGDHITYFMPADGGGEPLEVSWVARSYGGDFLEQMLEGGSAGEPGRYKPSPGILRYRPGA